jgi:hypothetical protein
MIVLGLFHGLIFLPVLLSLLGPDPYHSVSQSDEVEEQDESPKFPIDQDFIISKILTEGRETIL